ncbi:amino acid transporter AVT1I-like [Magnolia sinica]|uniref:amino acid transporter AVT1I-like n=1 Tax=Magnolia sinica TaxID=86752 RepID=UPI00265842B7|nr:amino acid transporter AVT1I-like [Magnolia sinica]
MEEEEGIIEESGSTFFRTLFNFTNATAGIGILSVPYALSQGGWLGFISLFVVATVCCYTGILLQRCTNGNAQIKSYSDVGERAFGHKGRIIASLFTYLELYLVAIEFLILEGDNLSEVLPKAGIEMLGWNIKGRKELIILAGIIVLPTMFLRKLSLLAYISAGGVLASIAVVVSVFCTGAESVGFHQKGRLFNFSGIPTAISIYAFCYGGHAVYPTIYASMRNKKRFNCILLLCFLLCTINYGIMAVTGYLMFGDDVKSQVTLNLRAKMVSSKIALYTTLINPFTKYALMVAPLAMAIEDMLQIKNRIISSLFIFSIRTLLVISTVVVALTVPFFGSLMAFIGSFLSSMVSMVLPCLYYLKISSSRGGKIELVLVWGILVMGVLIAITGTYSSVKQIVKHL